MVTDPEDPEFGFMCSGGEPTALALDDVAWYGRRTTLVLMCQTERGAAWLADHVSTDPVLRSYVVPPEVGEKLLAEAKSAGLSVGKLGR